jgi:hypothetical protein
MVVSLNMVSITVHFCTVVRVYCCTGSVYYGYTVLGVLLITSLPVYPNTVHGHCTTVVLDTSNSVYCIATLMECTVQCTALSTPLLITRMAARRSSLVNASASAFVG